MELRTKILLALVFLLILSFIFLLPHGGYRHAVEAYKEQLLAKGEKLTIAELVPPPFTNAPNGAKAFMDLMGSYRGPDDYPITVKMVVPGLAGIGFTNDTLEIETNYEQNVHKMAELLKILNSSSLYFNLDYSKGLVLPLPHLAKLQETEQLASITTMQALHAGNFPEAKLDLLTGVELVRLSTNESLIISDLVRVAMARIAIGATWEALQSDRWTDPELAELQGKWEEMELFSHSDSALLMERAVEIDALVWARKSYDGTGPYSGFQISAAVVINGGTGANSSLGDKLKDLYERYPHYWQWKSSWSYEEELHRLQVLDAELEVVRSTKSTHAFAPSFAPLNQKITNINEQYPDGAAHFRVVPLGFNEQAFMFRLACMETARRLTVTAIALKRYHLQHGAYPSTLTELVPVYLTAVPIDFMDGKPLRYKLPADGDFLLYSVGTDGEDNGGDPTPVQSSFASSSISQNWLTGRDIVWPRVATPAALEEYRQNSQTSTNALH